MLKHNRIWITVPGMVVIKSMLPYLLSCLVIYHIALSGYRLGKGCTVLILSIHPRQVKGECFCGDGCSLVPECRMCHIVSAAKLVVCNGASDPL